MLPAFRQRPDAHKEQEKEDFLSVGSGSGSEDNAVTTEEEIMKGRSTVDDIATFLQHMRCSADAHGESKQVEEKKARYVEYCHKDGLRAGEN